MRHSGGGTGRRSRSVGLVVGVAAGLVVLATALAGCTGSSDGPDSASSGSVQPASGDAKTFPVAPSASPSPVPALATVTNDTWTFVLTGVRKAGPGQVSVEGALTPKADSLMTDFAEDGYETFRTADGKSHSNWDFSGVQLTVAGDPKVYLAMRDDAGQCACTDAFITMLKADAPYSVYVVMTAPEGASTVDVHVKGLPTIKNVQVTS